VVNASRRRQALGDSVTSPLDNHNLEDVFVPACRVLAIGDIFSISILPGWPVGTEEVSRMASYAAARGVRLSIEGSDVIVLRKNARPLPTVRVAFWRRHLQRLAARRQSSQPQPVPGLVA
jgi:hypothetical protein